MTLPVKVDFVSDVICPWCFIGFVRLEQALARAGVSDARITLRPFQLDPSTPPGGVDLREHLSRKFGIDPKLAFARVESVARESGIPLDFEKVRRSPNTLLAHTLLEAAKERGDQRALARALFEAHFLEGRDVGDAGVLADIAAAHGFERSDAVAILGDAAAREAARREAAGAAARGISGVPFMIFQDRLAVSGAQSVDTLLAVLERARSLAASR